LILHYCYLDAKERESQKQKSGDLWLTLLLTYKIPKKESNLEQDICMY